jgi:hypothetical protein
MHVGAINVYDVLGIGITGLIQRTWDHSSD